MIQGVVLTAGQPEKYSAAVMGMATEAEAIDSRGKCTLQYAPLAARTPRSPSSHETGAPGVLLRLLLKIEAVETREVVSFRSIKSVW